ncbi:hypothetical protein [Nocardia araoensis]|nr:hypothetical protein [Nocardia araoensis]
MSLVDRIAATHAAVDDIARIPPKVYDRVMEFIGPRQLRRRVADIGGPA